MLPPGWPRSLPYRVKELDLEAFSPPAAGSVVKVIRPDTRSIAHRKAPLARARQEWPVGHVIRPGHSETGCGGTASRHWPLWAWDWSRGSACPRVPCPLPWPTIPNIIVVGADEADMLQAVRHLVDLGGGMAVVAGGRVLADLTLPIAGLISPEPLDRVATAYSRLKQTYYDLGGVLQDPFMALSFLAVRNSGPNYGPGPVDVDRFQVVSLFGED